MRFLLSPFSVGLSICLLLRYFNFFQARAVSCILVAGCFVSDSFTLLSSTSIDGAGTGFVRP